MRATSFSFVIVSPEPQALSPSQMYMIDDAARTCDQIVANGGQIVQEIGKDAPAITARFTDPAGNIVGLYQQPAA